MKILIVITKSELGGAQVFTLNLARGLQAAGEEVVVAGGPGNYLPVELSKYGITFKRLFNLSKSRNLFQKLKFIAELKEYVKSEGFDVVHLNSTNALLGVWGLSDLKPQPRLVFTVHDLSLLDSRQQALTLLKTAYRLFFKASFKKLHDIVFESQQNLNITKSFGLLSCLKAHTHLIYKGVSSQQDYWLSREEARKALKLKEEDFIYGSIGRLAYPKNYEFLIKTHRELKAIKPEAKLVLIGEGPERAKYEDIITLYQLSSEVVLRGEIPEASRYLKAFDLFVLPSIFEGLSLSLIEAKTAGVPVIASRVGGSEEIVGVQNCFRLDDAADYLRLVAQTKALPFVQTFTSEQMITSYLHVYRR